MSHAFTLTLSASMENAAEKNKESPVAENLEHETNWSGIPMCQYEGFWCPTMFLQPTLSYRKHFISRDTDITVAALPESGYTWIKALLFTIVNRHLTNPSPLLSNSPHSLVPNLECSLPHPQPHLDAMPSPRVFATHMPYHLLSNDSVKNSMSKIIYVSRNPLDQFVSEREYLRSGDSDPISVDAAFDLFCRGVHIFGPFWDNVLGYWKASRENPGRVLFVKYEDVRMDPVSCIDKIAEFVQMPFTDEERRRGLIEEMSNLCASFYDSREVGDWKKYLSPAMAERVERIVDAKMTAASAFKF